MSFLGAGVVPGEKTLTRVPIAEFLDGSPVLMPVATVGGRNGGPTLYVQAGIHGDEVTAIEAVQRALVEIDFSQLRGTLVVVPVANIPAYLSRTRGFLHEERWMVDINRIFPGNAHGLLTERIAQVLFDEFASAADLTIDLHSALDGCQMEPVAWVDPIDDLQGSLDLRMRVAHGFGTKYVFHHRRDGAVGTSDMSRTLSAQLDRIGKAQFSVDMGESRRATPAVVELGVRGLRNVLKMLEMLPGDLEVPAEQQTFTDISVVHTNHGGGLRRVVSLGDAVKSGQRLGYVVDIFGELVEELVSPCDGFVLRVMLYGSVASGAEAFWIGH